MFNLIAGVSWLLPTSVFSQFALEHSYPNAAVPVSGNYFYLVHLETLGDRYVLFDRSAKSLTFYDLNHVQVQFIDMSAAVDPNPGTPGSKQVLYISQFLFDMDPGIEVMLVCGPNMGNPLVTSIMDESGAVIQQFVDEAPYVINQAPQAVRPIYNTAQGTKLLLSHQSTLELKVYSLPGELTTDMIIADESAAAVTGQVRIYPNPSSNEVRIMVDPTSLFGQLVIRIYSEDGRMQYEQLITAYETSISTAAWSASNYVYVISRDEIPWCSGSVVKQ